MRSLLRRPTAPQARSWRTASLTARRSAPAAAALLSAAASAAALTVGAAVVVVALMTRPAIAGAEGSPDRASERPEIVVYAAASLRDVLAELTPALEEASGARVVFNYAGSNDLARQILAADKADLFFSADEAWMDKVAEAGLADPATRRSLLSNRLVVIAPRDSPLRIASAEDLARPAIARIALADPEAVPAGKYAKAWLEKKGVWGEAFRARVLSTADVRATLAAVASGNVDAGIVYKTDAAMSKDVRILYEVSGTDAPRVSYPLAVMAHSAHPNEARAAAQWLSGSQAGAVFERFGFIPLKTAKAP